MKSFVTSIVFIICLFLSSNIWGQVVYTLTHSPPSEKIHVSIRFEAMAASEVKLVIPRSGPGTYDLTNYLAFVDNVQGYLLSQELVAGQVGEGSYFVFEKGEELITEITYEVDINKMETELLGAFATSKLRSNYLGILGYSVFGFVEGLENKAIDLEINTDESWPIFSTLQPDINRKYGNETYRVENFSLLADAQYLLGNGVEICKIEDSPIPLFVGVYSETEIDIQEMGRRGLVALNGLSDYFGYIPMPHYTMCYEFLKPFSDRHDYGFSMEHLNSMTVSFDTSRAIKNYNPKARIGSTVHHMGHSWIPLRSYGTGYRPFEWQTAPSIETIWLNEGFIWYVAYFYVLDKKSIINRFQKTVADAPEYIQEKSLKELSLLGSTQYSLDFRIGRNLFSRGALLAHDLDKEIIKQSKGRVSIKEALLGLLKWTEVNQRAFRYDEIEPIMSKSTGVDLSNVWNQWQERN